MTYRKAFTLTRVIKIVDYPAVAVLDEMTIDDVHHYAMVDITPVEYNLITAPQSPH